MKRLQFLCSRAIPYFLERNLLCRIAHILFNRVNKFIKKKNRLHRTIDTIFVYYFFLNNSITVYTNIYSIFFFLIFFKLNSYFIYNIRN